MLNRYEVQVQEVWGLSVEAESAEEARQIARSAARSEWCLVEDDMYVHLEGVGDVHPTFHKIETGPTEPD